MRVKGVCQLRSRRIRSLRPSRDVGRMAVSSYDPCVGAVELLEACRTKRLKLWGVCVRYGRGEFGVIQPGAADGRAVSPSSKAHGSMLRANWKASDGSKKGKPRSEDLGKATATTPVNGYENRIGTSRTTPEDEERQADDLDSPGRRPVGPG